MLKTNFCLGVATFCRPGFTPFKSEEGLTGTLPSSKFDDSIGFYDGIEDEFSAEDLRALDNEGRCVLTCHQVEVNLYLFYLSDSIVLVCFFRG